MSICIPNSGPWTATSRVGTTLLAPVSVVVDTTAVPTAGFAGDLAFAAAGQATATSSNHKYMNRPGSPPRGRLR